MPAFKPRPFVTHSTDKKERLGEDDWRAFYESDSEESDDGAPKARGVSAPGKGKRKEIKPKGLKGSKKELGGRVKQMTSHEGIWSLESLKAGFTSAWMGLLSLPYVTPPPLLLSSPLLSLFSSPSLPLFADCRRLTPQTVCRTFVSLVWSPLKLDGF